MSGITLQIIFMFQINHIDISPNFASIMMGFTNSASNICGFLAPYIVALIVTDEVLIFSILKRGLMNVFKISYNVELNLNHLKNLLSFIHCLIHFITNVLMRMKKKFKKNFLFWMGIYFEESFFRLTNIFQFNYRDPFHSGVWYFSYQLEFMWFQICSLSRSELAKCKNGMNLKT